jgi:flagellar protein FlaG
MDIAFNNAQPVAAPKGREPAVTAAPVAVGDLSEREQPRAGETLPAVAPAEAERESLQQAVSSIEGFVQSIRRDLNFSLDDSSGRVVIKVTDSVSGDVIRQMPSEEALRLAESLEEVRSLLFKAEA